MNQQNSYKNGTSKRAKELHFQTLDGPTVITKRNFGLLRGKTIQEAPIVLVKSSGSTSTTNSSHQQSAAASNETSHQYGKPVEKSISPPPTPDSGCWSPSSSTEHVNKGPATSRNIGNTISTKLCCDRASTLWDWPLGEAKVINGPSQLEAQLNIFPFAPKEVWATVMGNELIVHCKSDAARPPWTGQREIFRCYMLPLNVNPKTAQFSIVHNRYLKVILQKEMPLKLAIAFYGGPESDEEDDSAHSSSHGF